MKVRHYRIACELLADALAAGAVHHVRIAEGLPRDAKVRGAFTDSHDQIILVVESETFLEIHPSGSPPYLDLVLEKL